MTVDGSPPSTGGSAIVGGNLGTTIFTEISLTGSPTGTSHTLVASVTDATTNLSATSVQVTVNVVIGTSSGSCSITLAPPTGTIFNETGTDTGHSSVVQDENLGSAGMQAKLTVNGTNCDGLPVTLTIGGTQGTPVTMMNGVAVFDQTDLPDTAPAALTAASQQLTVAATAGSGATAATESATYVVDSVSPLVNITSPLPGATLNNGNDVDMTIPGLQIDVQGADLPAFAGWLFDAGVAINYTIVSSVNGTLDTPLVMAPQLNPDGGPFSVEVTLPNGQQQLSFSAKTPTGNIATSNLVNVTAAAVPVIGFVAPTANEIINSTYGLVDGGVAFSIVLTTTASSQSAVEVCSSVPNGFDQPCNSMGGLFHVGTGTANGGHTPVNGVLGDDGAAANQVLWAFVSDMGVPALPAQQPIQVHIVLPVIESITVAAAYDAGGQLWWNSANVSATAGIAQGTVTVTLDAGDVFVQSDGGGPAQLNIGSDMTAGSASAGPFLFFVANVSGVPTATGPLSLPTDNGYALKVSVTDIWGNPSVAAPDFDLFVKTELPTCSISSPQAGGFFAVANNGNDAGSGNVLVPVTVSQTAADGTGLSEAVIDGTAAVSVNGTAAGSATTATSSVLVPALSSQGSDSYTGTVTNPAGNPAAVCTGGFSLTVDTVGPTLTVTVNPDPMMPNGDEYTSTRTVTGTVTPGPTLPVGTQITVSIGSVNTLVTVTTVGAPIAWSLSNVPNGSSPAVATAVDPAGNQGQGSAPVVVNVNTCDLALTSPAEIPLGNGQNEVLFNSATPSVTFNSTNCPNTSVTFYTTPQGGSTGQTSQNTDASGNVTFPLNGLLDGDSGTLYASIATGTTLNPVQYFVKLSLPTIGSTTPGVASFVVVAYQDNPYANTDGGPAGPGGFVFPNGATDPTNAYATFTVSGLSGLGPVNPSGDIGTATLTIGGTTYGTQQIVSAQTSVTFANVELNGNTYPTGVTVQIIVADEAGNQIPQSWTVVTDVIQPAAPAVTATMQDKHAATVGLSWPPPATGAGTPVGSYEARSFSTYLLQTPPALTEATYPTWGTSVPTSSVMLVGGQDLLSVTGLPTFNAYNFEVRSIDAVGNRSMLGAVAPVSSVAQGVANSWQQLSIFGADSTIPGGGSDFGNVVSSGHFTSSPYRDVVISAPADFEANSNPGTVYVLYGTGSYTSTPTSYTGLQALQIGTAGLADFMGYAVAAGDFSGHGNGIQDLAIGSPEWNYGQGRVDIFFGSANGLCGGAATCSTPNVTMYGNTNATFGFGVVNLGDLNADGIDDLLIGAPADTNGAGGVAYLFLGTASWPATPVAKSAISSPNTGDGLGAFTGAVALGDINGDGTPDFSIGAPGGGAASPAGAVYFISGAFALANATTNVTAAQVAPPLIGPGGCSSANNYSAAPFGYHCFGESSLDVAFAAGTFNDFLTTTVQTGLYLYPMTSAGAGTAIFSDDELNSGEGLALVSVDLNGDGKPDLIAGVNNNVSNFPTPAAGAYIYLNTGSGLPTTAPVPSAIIPPNLGTVTNGPDDFFGFELTAADLRNAGAPDFVISDYYPNGFVTVYY